MIQQLIEKIQKTKAPICVGLDPMLSYVPEHVKAKAFKEHGETLEGAAEAIWQFNKEIVDHTWDLIPSVKPQIDVYKRQQPGSTMSHPIFTAFFFTGPPPFFNNDYSLEKLINKY